MALEIKEYVGNGNMKTINETVKKTNKKTANKKPSKKGGKTSK
jgi:hypothetical protein